MAEVDPDSRLMLRDDIAVRWGFLDQEADGCAVVSERMELLFLNTTGRALAVQDWFAKRCWEVFPTKDENCLLRCPTIQALGKGDEIRYHEEALVSGDRAPMKLGVAMIPLPGIGDDKAAALLLLRPRDRRDGDVGFRGKVLAAAIDLRSRVV